MLPYHRSAREHDPLHFPGFPLTLERDSASFHPRLVSYTSRDRCPAIHPLHAPLHTRCTRLCTLLPPHAPLHTAPAAAPTYPLRYSR